MISSSRRVSTIMSSSRGTKSANRRRRIMIYAATPAAVRGAAAVYQTHSESKTVTPSQEDVVEAKH